MTFRAPKGTDDILPPESRVWARLLRIWDQLVERFGYELVMTPVFETTEVFARGVGTSTDIVRKEMYSFEDRAGRPLTLRPEATAGVMRAYLQAGRGGVLKAAYAGPMFRYERPQAGRRRQFFQVGVEYLGEAAAAADVEVIELGYRYYEEIGLGGVEVQLNTMGDPTTRPAYRLALLDYLRERIGELSEDSKERMEENPMRVLDSKVDGPKLADAPAPVDFLDDDAAAHYAAVKEGLERVGVPYVENRRLVRGIDYYTRTLFEYVSTGLDAAQNAVGGGGRYDGLAETLGGPAVSGVGLSLGIDRIALALDEGTAGPRLDLFVVVADAARMGEAALLVSTLRRAGRRVDFDPGSRSVKAQFRTADRRRAEAAVIVGDEWADGKVTVRHLADGSQELVEIGAVVEWRPA